MAVLANTCEGGVPPNAVTTANSGGASGNAWDRVENDSPVTYSATAAHGSVGILCNGAADAYVGWETGISGTSPTLWARAYVRFDALPAANTNILRTLSPSNGIMGTIRINTTGTLGMLYGTGSFAGNTTGTVTLGAWFRVEMMVTAGGANNGTMTMRVFWDPDATTPSQEVTSSNVTTGAVNPTRLRAGVLSNAATVFLDDIALSDEGWIGPADTGGGPVEGSLTAALPALTATLAGTARTSASAAAELPALVAALEAEAATGTGTLAAVFPALTGALTGHAAAAAELAGALPALTGVLESEGSADGALATDLPALTGEATGTAHTSAQLAAALPALGADLTGEAIPEGARLETALPALTADATGTAHSTGEVTAALPALTAAATAHTSTESSFTAALPALAADLTGTIGEAPAGTLDAALPALTADLTATGTAPATITAALPALTADLTQGGTLLPNLTGALTHEGDLTGTLTPTAALTGALSASGRLTGTVRR